MKRECSSAPTRLISELWVFFFAFCQGPQGGYEETDHKEEGLNPTLGRRTGVEPENQGNDDAEERSNNHPRAEPAWTTRILVLKYGHDDDAGTRDSCQHCQPTCYCESLEYLRPR